MYRISKFEQGSPQWHQDRLGKVTASVFDQVITKTGKQSSSIEGLINRAVAELVTGEPDDFFMSPAMERGSELEDEAAEFFNFSLGLNLDRIGFVCATDEEKTDLYFGCSPDGINLKEGYGGEYKCPLAHTHLGYLSSESFPEKYMQQVQGSMEILDLDRWFFGSYHPSFPSLNMFIERDKEYGEKLRGYLNYAHDEISKRFEKLKQRVEVAS
jgi:hypothetical protein